MQFVGILNNLFKSVMVWIHGIYFTNTVKLEKVTEASASFF